MFTSELVSEEPLSYVRQSKFEKKLKKNYFFFNFQVSKLFINEIIDVANEFNNQRQHYCLVLQWSSSELSILLSMIRIHVIEVSKFLYLYFLSLFLFIDCFNYDCVSKYLAHSYKQF